MDKMEARKCELERCIRDAKEAVEAVFGDIFQENELGKQEIRKVPYDTYLTILRQTLPSGLAEMSNRLIDVGQKMEEEGKKLINEVRDLKNSLGEKQ